MALSIAVTDNVGFTKRVVGLPGSLELVSRWGEPGSGKEIVRSTSAAKFGSTQIVAVGRASGLIQIMDCQSGRPLLSFNIREGLGSPPPNANANRALQQCPVSLSWQHCSSSSKAPPSLVSVSKDGWVCIRDLEALEAAQEQAQAGGPRETGGPPEPTATSTRPEGDGGQEMGSRRMSLVLKQRLRSSFCVLGLEKEKGPSGSEAGASTSSGSGLVEAGTGRTAGESRADVSRLFVECAELGPDGVTLAVGGKGVELSSWSLDTQQCSWKAKNPKPNSLGLVEEKWVTSLCRVGPTTTTKTKTNTTSSSSTTTTTTSTTNTTNTTSTSTSSSSSNVVAVGTSSGRIHLFDMSAQQRRPLASWEAAESPVTGLLPAGADVADGSAVVFSSRDGALGVADVMQGKLVGKLKGGTGGAVKALAHHPRLPLLASTGFDGYLRIHDLATRELKGQIFLKQVGTGIAFLEDVDVESLPKREEISEAVPAAAQAPRVTPPVNARVAAQRKHDASPGRGKRKAGSDTRGKKRRT